MSITQAIYEYIRACPLIERGVRVRFNGLGAEPQEFSIEEEPENIIVKRYIGSSIRQKTFNLMSRETYNEDQRVSIVKSEFYEAFYDWIEQQNRNRNFPTLSQNRKPTKIECLTAGYLYASEGDTAQYNIQIRLTYINEGER